ncbi:MAG: type II toxin-antitoxin system RelE/ParE family toxin [Propionibacteriaceae bacterium]|jgi:mRNA-degrading endonuclease RelE of RelBE toxin-antitoxin system|nr:type II toxin-antitoxin system RelE/ParE family toxin [Propionibacteriaceae bacterium]
MDYRVIWAPSARRQMESTIPPAVGAAVWEFVNGPLKAEPRRVGKPLRFDLEGYWSARRGEYRVIYRLIDKEIQIVRVSYRGDVYRSQG